MAGDGDARDPGGAGPRDVQEAARALAVCSAADEDALRRRWTGRPPPPIIRLNGGGGKVVRVALLSRAADPSDGVRFEFFVVPIDIFRPRAWVSSFRDFWCYWSALPQSRKVTVEFDPVWIERMCVHSAVGIYCRICAFPLRTCAGQGHRPPPGL